MLKYANLNKFIFVTFALALWIPSASAITYKTPAELYNEADLVVTGQAIQIDQEMGTTTIQFKIEEVLKGVSVSPHLTVKASGGRVYPAKDEPQFLQIEKYMLFLKAQGAHYICLNKADGQKIVRNENIYPYAGNLTFSQPLKDYLKNFPKPSKS